MECLGLHGISVERRDCLCNESNRATMTQIARNLAPSGRYDYDPKTGGYNRYTPYY